MKKFSVAWRSPSNIALVKYWGKENNQIPMNPSISFTLDKCATEMTIHVYEKNNAPATKHQFYFDQILNEKFGTKTLNFISNLAREETWLDDYILEIYSSNSFPHSAGIASSASSMSALALCLQSIKQYHFNTEYSKDQFMIQVSDWARRASGSACRSIYPKLALWGEMSSVVNSSNIFATDWSSELHPLFNDICDAIFIVNQSEKSVSSSLGHELMNAHHYRDARRSHALANMINIITALKQGDWDAFIRITEEEALSLHALMMSSNPGYVLLEGDSIRLIHAIRKLRSDHKLAITFSIDAGPNIHVLYLSIDHGKIMAALQHEFASYFTEGKIIFDRIGGGPKKLF